MNISEAAKKMHENARDKGFWDNERNFNEALMLVVSEAGECCEAYRKNDWNEVGEELADIVIRVFDLAEGFNIDIENVILRKMEYNKTRPHMHDKKC